jgi:hypothetical protein
MPKFMNTGGNAAPSGVNYSEARLNNWAHNWQAVADYAQVNKKFMHDRRIDNKNLAPLINGQTFWAANVVSTPNGVVPRSVAKKQEQAKRKK